MPAPKGNTFAKGNKGGRPTLYDPKYCQEIIKFFDVKPYYKETVAHSQAYGKTGKVSFEKKEWKNVPNELPSLYKFANKIGVDQTTLNEWAKRHQEFSLAFTRAKEMYKNFLMENGLLGLYDSRFAIFVAKNTTDMRDKVETELTIKEMPKPLLDNLRNKKNAIPNNNSDRKSKPA